MKKYLLKMFFIPVIGILFTGCYTTLLVPSGDYNKDDVMNSQKDNYYRIEDYGDYYYYYNEPWWFSTLEANQSDLECDNNANSFIRSDYQRGDIIRNSNTLTELPSVSLPAIILPSTGSASASVNSNHSKINSSVRVKYINPSNQSSGGSRNSNNSNSVKNNDTNRNTLGR